MVKAFPTISTEEFAEACSRLEEKVSGRLDGTSWLGLTWDKDGALHIKKHSKVEPQRNGNYEQDTNEDNESIEPDDKSTLHRPVRGSAVAIDFSIIISPTYQVPVLWFIFLDLPENGPQGIDAVYQYLVPSASAAQVKDLGVMGGISIANHPISDVPAFFIHPCNTQEALLSLRAEGESELSPYQYFLLWLGLIGPHGGLYMPSQFVPAAQ